MGKIGEINVGKAGNPVPPLFLYCKYIKKLRKQNNQWELATKEKRKSSHQRNKQEIQTVFRDFLPSMEHDVIILSEACDLID